MDWLLELTQAINRGAEVVRPANPLPGDGCALALAPHPDDPEAVAVTLRMLAEGGWTVHYGIVTSGWSGVRDDFVGPSATDKARAREAEQREAARRFGLPADHLTFLRLHEDPAGDLDETEANRLALCAYLDRISPTLLLLPHGDDGHPTHRLVYAWMAQWASAQGRPIAVLGNEDPKTRHLRPDLTLVFREDLAVWKAGLLECHVSQSVRNQASRGITFAERILAMNRAVPGRAPGQYAERFQLAQFPGGSIGNKSSSSS